MEASLDVRLLEKYIKNYDVEYLGKKVQVDIISTYPHIAFRLALDTKEPTFGGAFPQRKFAFEKHLGPGHEGVHVQIWYHLVENELGVGAIYLILEVLDDHDLLELSEGFIFAAYETLMAMGPDFQIIAEKIFNVDTLEILADKKDVLIERMILSLADRKMEIRLSDKKEPFIAKKEDIELLLGSRKELVPMFGALTER